MRPINILFMQKMSKQIDDVLFYRLHSELNSHGLVYDTLLNELRTYNVLRHQLAHQIGVRLKALTKPRSD